MFAFVIEMTMRVVGAILFAMFIKATFGAAANEAEGNRVW